MTRTSTWLTRTGQMWKIWVQFAPAAVMAGAMVLDQVTGYRVAPGLSAALAIPWFVWMFTSLTCRRCKRRVAWPLLRTCQFRDWPEIYWRVQECPVCGDSGSPGLSAP